MHPMRIPLGFGLMAAAAWIILALAGGAVMPSYLAAWLFCLAFPVGALPLLMLAELFGIVAGPILTSLRRMVALLPLVALFCLPVLLHPGVLYRHPVAGAWMAHGAFAGRMIVMLLLWSVMALAFMRPPLRAPRTAMAAAGLCLHLVIGTVAAFDWIMALDPSVNSSLFGLLAMSGQISAALCAAVFVQAAAGDRALPTRTAPLLLVAIGSWLFLHFIQFLIIWSADLPSEIGWYQDRIGGLGGAAIWFGVAAVALAFAAMLPRRLARNRALLASVSAMLLLVHLLESLWMVTPSLRRRFDLPPADLLAMLSVAALAAGCLLSPRMRHEPT